MKLSTFLSVKAVISLLFGIASVLAPTALMSLFGATLDPAGELATRLLGAMLIGIGLICWFEKDAKAESLKGITLALFIGDAIGFIVVLMAQLSGVMNTLGWTMVALWLLLALGSGYFRYSLSGANS